MAATSPSDGMKLISSWRSFMILATMVVLVFPSLLIYLWINNASIEIQEQVTGDFHRELVLEVEKTAKSLSPFNQSAINLASLLSPLLGRNNQLHFSTIETEVAPVMFQALSTIPYLSQVSFIALNGLFFSYYKKGNKKFAVYSNTSSTLSFPGNKYTWYIRPVNVDKQGKLLYGEAIETAPRVILDSDWFQEAMRSKNGHASPGTGWEINNDRDDDPLVLNTVGIGTKGAISLGFPWKSLMEDFFSNVVVHGYGVGGGLYFGSIDGTVFRNEFGIPNTRMVLVDDGNSVSIQLLNPDGNGIIGTVANLSCSNNNSTQENIDNGASIVDVGKKKYFFQCSPIEILGMPSVYVLASRFTTTIGQPKKKNIVQIFKIKSPIFLSIFKIKSPIFLQIILPVGAMAIFILTLFLIMYRAARREKGLHEEIIKLKEDTQQAERKRMNTILAYASASHDVRAALAAITGLVDLCLNEVSPIQSTLEINLRQAQACTKDLLGIINSVLDSSKIEAGKINLEKEEFNIEQLIEETVDLYYPVGIKKGVDVLLDSCDGSVRKYPKAMGDRRRLKQILANLLSNAVKFTSQGHISVRVWAKLLKPQELTVPPPPAPAASSAEADDDDDHGDYSSPRNSSTLRRIFCMPFFYLNDINRNKDLEEAMDFFITNDGDGDDAEKEGENLVEYIFEVNDTGKGIPKEMREVVFENYVQVEQKQTTASNEHEGTGLGLGIVQSLVRLMGGEIAVVDKEVGEVGTCFRFNIILPICGTPPTSSPTSTTSGDYLDVQDSGESFHHSSSDKSHEVILFISGEERSNVLKKLIMRRLGIQVSVVNEYQQLPITLENMKEKLLSSTITPNNSVALMMVVETSAGPFQEVGRIIAEFRKFTSDHNIFTRVVWIGGNRDIVQYDDLIIPKPLHGSRAYQLIGLLRSGFRGRSEVGVIIDRPTTMSAADDQQEIQEEIDNSRLFLGKKVLVAEDNFVLRKIAIATLSRLGAETHGCENGEEALQLVLQDLNYQREHRAAFSLPFNFILMDCEMPKMDGYEATRRIREVEKQYGLHIPIIALTAHTGDEMQKINEAGMDYCLFKPLSEDQLLEAKLYMQGSMDAYNE